MNLISQASMWLIVKLPVTIPSSSSSSSDSLPDVVESFSGTLCLGLGVGNLKPHFILGWLTFCSWSESLSSQELSVFNTPRVLHW